MNVNDDASQIEEANPVTLGVKQRPPVTAFRLDSAECSALSGAIRRVQRHACEYSVAGWSPELGEKIDSLATYFVKFSQDTISRSHRVRMDALDLAIVMFGLTQVNKDRKHDLIQFSRLGNPASLLGLRDGLEKYRKRAKRAWLRHQGISAYREAQRSWRKFVASVRTPVKKIRLEDYGISPPKWWREIQFKYVREMLIEAKFWDMPDDKTLWDLTRKMVRNALRGRGEATVRDIYYKNWRAKQWVVKFIGREVRKMRLALIAQARADPTCLLAKSVAGWDEVYGGDDEYYVPGDWIGIQGQKMTLQELQRACHSNT